jgi:hypothetical protein
MARDLKREREIALAERGDLKPRKIRAPREKPKRATSADTRRWLRAAEADLEEQREAAKLLEEP